MQKILFPEMSDFGPVFNLFNLSVRAILDEMSLKLCMGWMCCEPVMGQWGAIDLFESANFSFVQSTSYLASYSHAIFL